MKNIRRILCVALVAMFLCASALPAFAASDYTFYAGGKGSTNVEYIGLPDYTAGDKVTDIKSSNKKIFKVHSFDENESEYTEYAQYEDESDYSGSDYYASIGIELLKKGSAKLTYKVNGKSKSMSVQVLAYKNPVKSFVLTGLGSKNLKSKFAKSSYAKAKSKKAKAGLLKVTAASGWKIRSISFYDVKAKNTHEVYSWENPVSSMQMHVPAMKKGREYYANATFCNTKNNQNISVTYHLTKK